jgi:2,4-dienoyl-CoA reductase-like NADH-dependent reductase (Old Yellow Enzyme family)
MHIVNPAVAAIEKGIEPDPGALRMLELMRERYRGTLIIAGGFDHDTAEGWLQQGKADLIAFGRKFLADPDLHKVQGSGIARYPDQALSAQDDSVAALLWGRSAALAGLKA